VVQHLSGDEEENRWRARVESPGYVCGPCGDVPVLEADFENLTAADMTNIDQTCCNTTRLLGGPARGHSRTTISLKFYLAVVDHKMSNLLFKGKVMKFMGTNW
jgi:hypothetical protein